MKRRKLKPRKGSQILLMGVYVKAANSDFESVDWYTYYWDKKRRRLFEEWGLDVTPIMRHQKMKMKEGVTYYNAWASKRPQRSISALLKKIDDDFNRLNGLFDSYDILIEEVGRL